MSLILIVNKFIFYSLKCKFIQTLSHMHIQKQNIHIVTSTLVSVMNHDTCKIGVVCGVVKTALLKCMT